MTGPLYRTDAEIIAALGVCEKVGYRAIHELEKRKPNRKPFPAKDPLFGGKRFWPAVFQWFCDYYGVRTAADAAVPEIKWEEHFDAPAPRKAGQPEHAGPVLAPS